jgi:Protein of unknown function (DUF1194)
MTRTISRRTATGLLAAASIAAPTAAFADGAVDLQLVLAVDTSGSVNRTRFELQRDGYANAFRDPVVQRVILGGKAGGIAVCLTHWTGPGLNEISQSWTRLGDAAACADFGDRITTAPRLLSQGGTSISGAIDHSRLMFSRCPFGGIGGKAPRRVIDISGDGENNRGRSPDSARDEAVSLDMTINGLPILAIEPNLDTYYRDHVIGGPGAFLIAAQTFEMFGEAVRRKLVQEIA